MADESDDYYYFYIFGVQFGLWYSVLAINLLVLTISYIAYRIIFFHGYQVSLNKTLNILQTKSVSGTLTESKNKKWDNKDIAK